MASAWASQQGRVLLIAVIAGHERDAGLLHQLLGGGLRAHRADRLRGRADEHDAFTRASRGEVLVLGQEAVARMDRLGAGFLGGVENRVDPQITLPRRRGTDQHRLVGEPDMPRAGVGLRIDRHRPDAEAAAGFDHPAGDLTAIGDQNFLEHGAPPARIRRPGGH